MKKLLLLISIMLVGLTMSAQQDAQYTQFMFNKIAYNPGYAGSAEVPSLTAIYRNQWAGLEGAPKTQVLSFHSPVFNERTGLGATIVRDEIGPTESIFVALSYAYRIKLRKGTLGLGLQGVVRNYRVRWDDLEAAHAGDQLVSEASGSKILPNAGLGAYYETEQFYLGMSIPHLVKNDISLVDAEVGGTQINATENIHAYLMSGFIIKLNNSVKFKPGVLLKLVDNAPFDMDLNAGFVFMNKLETGISYRLGGSTAQGFGESLDFILQYYINNTFRIGTAYDLTLSELERGNSGSYELLLQYNIQKKNEKFTNPRFF
jgi:type IX secretion system PorP/SprF family membrane protein